MHNTQNSIVTQIEVQLKEAHRVNLMVNHPSAYRKATLQRGSIPERQQKGLFGASLTQSAESHLWY